MNARWILPPPLEQHQETLAAALMGALGCPLSVAEILARRGIVDAAQAADFLAPKLKRLSDPFLLPEMRAAVERTLAAIDRGERIVLYGDYDVDGVTSLALLMRILRAYGAKPEAFLPSRMDEGYGLSPEGIARCVETFAPQLLIAVDCGTASAAEIATLTGQGVDVVVIDHHECPTLLPRCTALVNPKRTDAEADFTYLCSAGLVFKFCHALLKVRSLADFDLREHLDLVALGTVADIVPLIAENRVLVQKGLETMARTRWAGVKALMEVAGVGAPLTPGDVGFKLGPRLNASGRLGTAQESLELLLTDDPERARALARELDAHNRERQNVEKTTATQAQAQIGFDPADAAIVVGAPGWHPGVLGIVAARICRQYHRPTLVIGFDENGLGKGSGRSIAGFSLVKALGQCAPLLEKFGGHEMAAGMALRQEQFEAFREAFKTCARALLSDEALLPRITLDGEMAFSEISLDFLGMHERLQPFGMGNAQPLLLARGVRPLSEPAILKEKHLRLALGQGKTRQEAIFFNGAAAPLPRPPWDIAFRIERNEWQGRVRVQIQVQRIRTAE
ncbi:MAG: single-stranded-DNA-specific exonuclease RecJ [Verrucomicrobia bacterium]|nr:single-stranded-DNA-specific exonuclease RecJ [Verrucomicrobiota bacterium]